MATVEKPGHRCLRDSSPEILNREPPIPESPVPKPETHWRIVLVRPRNPLNIGAAARAMANFGFGDLVVVEPYTSAWQEARSAVGAEEILRSARAACSLADALDGIGLVVGTTSGNRRKLDRQLLNLQEFSEWIGRRAPNQTGALLFGSEKTGLTNEQLSYCHALVRIPTAARCPSMNLGQAVAVFCFELARTAGLARFLRFEKGQSLSAQTASPLPKQEKRDQEAVVRNPTIAPPEMNLASIQSLEHLFERVVRVLDEVGYLKPKERRATIVKLRRALVDRRLSSYEAKILGGMLAQIEWKLKMCSGVNRT
ncbi:MAG TPA: TrmH family RNA methyltransferase [Terriglobia bacterium]|nr:TrmH family RNA methyltransferase [Terriglobia bacterium]